jgi:hypothetical protein
MCIIVPFSLGWYNLCQPHCSNYSFGANDPRRGIISMYMELFGLLGTIILSTLHPWWSSWISDQENATILHDQNRIINCQHLLVDVDIHTTYISKLLNCNHTAPSVCSEYVDILQSNISHLHVVYVLHILISPPQHTYMGTGILEVQSIYHFISRIIQRGLYSWPVCWLFFRRIPDIRERFVPQKECQESEVNVTSWYPPSFISMYKNESGLPVWNLIFAIFCK